MTIIHLKTNGRTVTRLAQHIHFESRACATLVSLCGKLDISGITSSDLKPYYLCCDLLDDVYLHNHMRPVLSRFTVNSKGTVNSSIQHMVWIPLKTKAFSKIKLYICNELGETVSFRGKGVYCTLLIKDNGYSW